VEAELAGVKPMVDEAKRAVNGINKSNLDELRSLKMPPDAIINVLTAVMRVFKQTDTKWANMKTFLGQRGVIE
jgi:dynein heavy chain 2